MALLAPWLADFQLLAAALLLGVMLAIAALRQPAQRLAVAKSTLAALAALAILCALPGWSLVHLLSEPPVASEPIASTIAAPTPVAPTAATFAPPFDAEASAAAPPIAPSVAPAQPAPPIAKPIDWIAVTAAVYVMGSGTVTLWLIIGALLAHRVRREATPAPPELQQLLQELCGPEKSTPQLLISPRITAPVALGLRRPAILLPPPSQGGARGGIHDVSILIDSESRSPLPPSTLPIQHSPFPISSPQLLPILAHEQAHLQHRDLHTIAATRLLLVLLWPQPLYWLLRRTIRLDQETLADAAAADRAGRLDYAQQLLAWARTASTQRPPRLAGAVGLWEGPSQLKRRIAVLLNEQFNVMRSCSKTWKVLSIGCIIFLATMLSLVTLQPALSAPETETQTTDVQSTVKPEANTERQAEQEQAARMRALVGQLIHKPNVFMGYCVDESGRPLAGVDVSLFVYETSAKNVEPVASVKSAVDGRFEFDRPIDVAKEFPNGVPEDHFVESPVKIIAVVAQAQGRTTEFKNEGLHRFAKRGQIAILRMSPSQTLSGRVTDDQGEPVANAVVTTDMSGAGYIPNENLRARTNAEGRYEIDDLPCFDVVERQREYAAARQRNEPWAMHADPSVLVTVQHPEFATRRVNAKTFPGKLDVTLLPGATIKGRVVAQSADANDPPRPLGNVPVWIMRTKQPVANETNYGYALVEQQRGTTDANGNYSFSSLPASEYAVTATAPRLTTAGLNQVEVAVGQTTTAPDVVLSPGAILRVQLVDGKTKEPLKLKAGQKGYVLPQRLATGSIEAPRMDSQVVAFTADGVGETRVAPGRYNLFVSLPGEGLSPNMESRTSEENSRIDDFEVSEGDVMELDVPMAAFPIQPASGVTPTVAPADSVDNAVDANVYPPAPPATGNFIPIKSPADGNQPSVVPIDADPAHDSSNDNKGTPGVPSDAPSDHQGDALPTPTEPAASKTLNVQVLNRRGEPIAGAVVTPTSFMTTNGSSVWPNTEYPGWAEPKPQTTDAEGRATFAYDVPKQLLALFTPQDLLCSVEHPDYVVVSNHETWNEGTKVYVLDEGAIIEFTTTAGGEALPAAGSHLLNASGQRQARDAQVVEGRVRLPRIDAGVREVRAVHIDDDGRPLFSPVVQRDLASGETERLQLPVEPGVRVEGRLDDAVPRPVKNGRVIAVAIPAGDFKPPQNTTRPSWSTSATINEDGTFVLEDLPAGDDLKVIALCDGYFAPSQHFPETSADPQIPWPPQTFPLRDRVNRLTLRMAPTATCEIEARDEQGQPVADAQVVIHTNVTWHLMLNGPYGAAMDSLDRLRGVKAPATHPVDYTAMTDKEGVARITNVASLEPIVYVSVQNANYRLAPISYALPFYGPPIASLALKPGQTARRPVNLVEFSK
jgi:beta-lactamase regulating signal transducer with metallopeptidase domain